MLALLIDQQPPTRPPSGQYQGLLPKRPKRPRRGGLPLRLTRKYPRAGRQQNQQKLVSTRIEGARIGGRMQTPQTEMRKISRKSYRFDL